jgi:hypothetical protein
MSKQYSKAITRDALVQLVMEGHITVELGDGDSVKLYAPIPEKKAADALRNALRAEAK